MPAAVHPNGLLDYLARQIITTVCVINAFQGATIIFNAALFLMIWFASPLQSFIPKRLDEVANFERDADRITSGKNTEGIYYQNITGMKDDLSGVRETPTVLASKARATEETAAGRDGSGRQAEAAAAVESRNGTSERVENTVADKDEVGGEERHDDEGAESDSDTSGSSDSDSEGEGSDELEKGGKDRDAERAARKEHKRKVKEDKREQRKVKVPKALKKKKMKKAKEKNRTKK